MINLINSPISYILVNFVWTCEYTWERPLRRSTTSTKLPNTSQCMFQGVCIYVVSKKHNILYVPYKLCPGKLPTISISVFKKGSDSSTIYCSNASNWRLTQLVSLPTQSETVQPRNAKMIPEMYWKLKWLVPNPIMAWYKTYKLPMWTTIFAIP